MLRKGALVARDPTNYEDIGGPETLEEQEVEALRQEVLHKWRQPLALYMTIIICSVGAAVQGWDQTGQHDFFLPSHYRLQGVHMLGYEISIAEDISRFASARRRSTVGSYSLFLGPLKCSRSFGGPARLFDSIW